MQTGFRTGRRDHPAAGESSGPSNPDTAPDAPEAAVGTLEAGVESGAVRPGPAEVSEERRDEVVTCLTEVVGADLGSVLTARELGLVTGVIARREDLWREIVVEGQDPRWYALLHRTHGFDLWLLAWEAGHDTDWHDHGGSSGSFAVAQGRLVEDYRRPRTGWIGTRTLRKGGSSIFGPAHVHCVSHGGGGTAVSVHAYSPPLVAMTYYELGPFGLSAVETVPVDSPEDVRRARSEDRQRQTTPGDNRAVDEWLSQARGQLERLAPAAAAEAIRLGATLVDLRPAEERSLEGDVPGAVPIARNVLEWRLDPQSSARIPELARYDSEIILMCTEGYASSLAAVILRRIGLQRVTDLDGGFRGWKAAGLPTTPAVRD